MNAPAVRIKQEKKKKTVFICFAFCSLLVLTDFRKKKKCDFVSIGLLIYFTYFPWKKKTCLYTYISADICIYKYIFVCVLFPAEALERRKKNLEGGVSEVAVIRTIAIAEEIEETGLSQVSHISVAVT